MYTMNQQFYMPQMMPVNNNNLVNTNTNMMMANHHNQQVGPFKYIYILFFERRANEWFCLFLWSMYKYMNAEKLILQKNILF